MTVNARIKKGCFGSIRKKIGYLIFPLVWAAIICQPAHGQMSDAILAWVEIENRVANIHFSKRTRQKWSDPKQLSFSNNPEILPTLAFDQNGEMWVVWTELDVNGGKLQFCHYLNGKWKLPKPIRTHSTSDMAPSVIVDGNEDVWLVWSGTEQADDDIYFSVWKNGDWTEPARVNIDDDWPDILPQLDLNDAGMPKVAWKGYNGNKYATFVSHWTGVNWSPEQESVDSVDASLSDENSRKTRGEIAEMMSELSAFGIDQKQATIHYRLQGKGKTVRLKR